MRIYTNLYQAFILFVFILSMTPSSLLSQVILSSHAENRSAGNLLPERTISFNDTSLIQVSYEFESVSAFTKKVKNTDYHILNIEGFSFMNELGKPAIPARNDIIALPAAAGSVVILNAEYREYENFNVHPALAPALDTEGAGEPDFVIDQKTYNTDFFFPEKLVEISEIQYLRGMPVATVQIRPVQFNPKTGKLRVYSKITYQIKSGQNQLPAEISAQSTSHYMNFLNGLLLNASQLPPQSSTYLNPSRKDYIIITHTDYLAAADSLANWKRQLGYTVELIHDTAWTAASVKDSIHTRFQNWIPRPDYFLIIGDHDDVPAEIHQIGNPPEDYATDLYFACMDGSSDYYPDMAHGRISVSSPNEASVVIRKIMDYEIYPVADSAFYQTGVNCAQFQDDDKDDYADRRFTHTSEEIRDYVMSQGYDVTRIYYTGHSVNPVFYNNGYYSHGDSIPADLLKPGFGWNGYAGEIENMIDSGCFYLLHRDHGYVGGSGWAHPEFVKSHIDNLNNGNKLPVVFSINCHTGEFKLTECFAEKFLRKKNAGAVGVFAASYYSYSGYNDGLTIGFFDAIWPNPGLIPDFGSGGANNPSVSSHEPIYTMGDVLNHGKIRMVQTWNSSRFQFELFHYFGDPTMQIYTAAPQSITATHPDTLSDQATAIFIQNASCPDALATMTYEGMLIGKTTLVNGQGVIYFNTSPDTTKSATLTLSKHNYIPYQQAIFFSANQAPVNDDPCTAFEIPVKKYCDPMVFSSYAADSSTNNPGCGSYHGKDVWFKIIIPADSTLVVEGSLANSGFSNGAMAVYSGPCNSLSLIACNADSGMAQMPRIVLQSQTPGDTLFVQFWDEGGQNPGGFGICAYTLPKAEYTQLPYFADFENGLDMHWDTISSNGNGVVELSQNHDPYSGQYHLLMDADTAGTYVTNKAVLFLDLSHYQDVQMKLWWKEFNDEDNSTDGIFFSDDGGQNFTRVFGLYGDHADWTQLIFDVDQLAAIHGLSLSQHFQIKFQQYDNWPIGSDGFAFDDIHVYSTDTLIHKATIPYYTGFETGLDSCWTATGNNYNGRIRVAKNNSPYADSVHLLLDVESGDNNYNRNWADLHIDLSSDTNVLLKLYFREFGDESHEEDGIFVSDDGGLNFTKLISLTGNISGYTPYFLDIDEFAVANSMQLTDDFVIRLQQYDNYSIGTDGFGFDEVSVTDQETAAKILVYPDTLFFATDTGTQQLQSFHVHNSGADTLFAYLGSIPNSMYDLNPLDFVVAPGDTQEIVATFTPEKVRSYNTSAIYFGNSWPNTDTLIIRGEGTTPPMGYFQASLDTIDFDTVALNSTATQMISIENTGTGASNVIDINTPTGFSITGDTAFAVNAGSYKLVFVRFSPTQMMPYAGYMVIETDANNDTVYVMGVGDNLSGIHTFSLQDMDVFPVPASSSMYIRNDGFRIQTYRIYTVDGRLLSHVSVDDKSEVLEIPVVNFSNGVYYLLITTEEGIMSRKVIIQH